MGKVSDLSPQQLQLYFSINKHQLDSVDSLLSDPINVNFVHPETGMAPLHLVASLNFKDILLLMMSKTYVDVDIVDRKFETALHKAVTSHGDGEMILLFVRLGASLGRKNISGITVASLLFQQRHDDEFWLVVVGNDVDCNVLASVRSPILYINKLFKEKTRGAATQHSKFAQYIHRLLCSQDVFVLRVLVLWQVALVRAAASHSNESADLLAYAHRVQQVTDQLFNCDSMDMPVNMQKLLNAEMLVGREESLLKYQINSLRPSSLLDLCLRHQCKFIFSKQQISGFIDTIFWSSAAFELSKYQRREEKEGHSDAPFHDPSLQHHTALESFDIIFRILRLNPFDSEWLRLTYSVRTCPAMRFFSEAVSKVFLLLNVAYISIAIYSTRCSTVFSESCSFPLTGHEVILSFSLFTTILYEVGELAEAGWRLSTYFSDEWNLADFSGLVLLLLWVWFRSASLNIARVCLALSAIPLSLGQLRYLTISRSLGLMVSITRAMISDLMAFLAVFVICAIGFGIFFEALFSGNEAFHSPGSTMLQMFSFSLNSFDFTLLDSPNAFLTSLGQIVLALYLVFVAILLINLLIAKMSSAYQRIDEKASEEWAYNKTKTVQKHLLLEEKHVFCMLPPPFNAFTASLALFEKPCAQKYGVSLGGTVTNVFLYQLLSPMRALLFLRIISPAVRDVLLVISTESFPSLFFLLFYCLSNASMLLIVVIFLLAAAVCPFLLDLYYTPLPKPGFHVVELVGRVPKYLYLPFPRSRLFSSLFDTGQQKEEERSSGRGEGMKLQTGRETAVNGRTEEEGKERGVELLPLSRGVGEMNPLHRSQGDGGDQEEELELKLHGESGLSLFDTQRGDSLKSGSASSVSFALHRQESVMGGAVEERELFSHEDIKRILQPLVSAAGERDAEGLSEELAVLRGEVEGLRAELGREVQGMKEDIKQILLLLKRSG